MNELTGYLFADHEGAVFLGRLQGMLWGIANGLEVTSDADRSSAKEAMERLQGIRVSTYCDLTPEKVAQ